MKKSDSDASPLVRWVVERFEADLPNWRGTGIPSASQLCHRFGVSRPTLTKALRHLEVKGLLRLHRGRRPTWLGLKGFSADAESGSFSVSAAAKSLAGRLEERISEGGWRAGDALPKLSALCAEEKVSLTTLQAALHLLKARDILHRAGRYWIAGKSSTIPEAALRLDRRPVLLLLQEKSHAWKALGDAERTARFATAFEMESERCGIRMMAVGAYGKGAPKGMAARWEDIRKVVKSLGPMYFGTLIPRSLHELPDLAAWASFLLEFGRPVVWFDRFDELLPDRPDHPLFTRCHFSETAAVAQALSHLNRFGHRCVLYPIGVWWARTWPFHRLALLRTQASHIGLKVVPVLEPLPEEKGLPPESSVGDSEPPRVDPAAVAMAAALEPLRVGKLSASELRERLSWYRRLRPWATSGQNGSPLLAEILSHESATAILAPNDAAALSLYRAMAAAGIEVPEAMSLLSFDNSRNLNPPPISSVDFGFGYLGYAAFHLLLGDIPVQRAKGGELAARPIVVDRGSLSRPRHRRRQP